MRFFALPKPQNPCPSMKLPHSFIRNIPCLNLAGLLSGTLGSFAMASHMTEMSAALQHYSRSQNCRPITTDNGAHYVPMSILSARILEHENGVILKAEVVVKWADWPTCTSSNEDAANWVSHPEFGGKVVSMLSREFLKHVPPINIRLALAWHKERSEKREARSKQTALGLLHDTTMGLLKPRATNTERIGVRDNKRECQHDHQEALYNCIPSRCLIEACSDIEMCSDTKTIQVHILHVYFHCVSNLPLTFLSCSLVILCRMRILSDNCRSHFQRTC